MGKNLQNLGMFVLSLVVVMSGASRAAAEASTFSVLTLPESIATGMPLIDESQRDEARAATEATVSPSDRDGDPSEDALEDSAEAQQAMPRLALRPMADLGVSITLPAGKLPTDYAAQQATPVDAGSLVVRGWPELNYCWAASGSRHHPLYFEEVNAERYGYGCRPCLQPVVSAAHFFGTIPALPYLWMADCPRECVYTLGHYRPGSCSPWRRHRLPRRLDAAVVEGAAIAGLIFLLP